MKRLNFDEIGKIVGILACVGSLCTNFLGFVGQAPSPVRGLILSLASLSSGALVVWMFYVRPLQQRIGIATSSTPIPPVPPTERDSDAHLVAAEKAPKAAPDPIERSVRIEDGRSNPKLNWPLKIRVVLFNRSERQIVAGRPEWHASDRQGRLHNRSVDPKGVGGLYRVEKLPDGAASGRWGDEGDSVAVPAGTHFSVWFGLDPAQDRDALQRMHDVRKLGTLVVPLTVDGKAMGAKFPL